MQNVACATPYRLTLRLRPAQRLRLIRAVRLIPSYCRISASNIMRVGGLTLADEIIADYALTRGQAA